jgi:hypothetical protein
MPVGPPLLVTTSSTVFVPTTKPVVAVNVWKVE